MVDDKKDALLQSAVRAMAKYGVRDLSTRSISRDAGLNDAYIYRLFTNREDLLAQAYLMEDEKFLRFLGKIFEAVGQSEDLPLRQKAAIAFHSAWRYMIDTPDVCRVFMYYYHSPNFVEYAQREHERMMGELTESIAALFPSFDDAHNCLLTLFAVINTFALGVVNGVLPDTTEVEQKVFGIICASLHIWMHPEQDAMDGEA